ncbi:hypothetical protein [Streptomyces sp. SID13031]|uniref:hypothetical protein n=1 Tax=Streptomyces sp. SID13031 TaxID=2706046 RepID=UPI0013C5B11C|nr:hypothetical protein [Streptomyces sp. SID13031]NEA37041.1 hypothetical protein [Streptomyces sp. SID13031]
MAAGERTLLLVQEREVELILGDLFESDADFLVVPCGPDGRMSPAFKQGLAELGILSPAEVFEPGEIKLAGQRTDSEQGIWLAAVVTSPEAAERAVWKAAQSVGEQVTNGGSAAFPLLGSGAIDHLSPVDSLTAIAAGYGKHPGALRIHVLDPAIYNRLIEFATPPHISSSGSVSAQLGSITASAEGRVTPAREELVPTHTDGPAYVDELGREGFARVLARRIRDARMEEG